MTSLLTLFTADQPNNSAAVRPLTRLAYERTLGHAMPICAFRASRQLLTSHGVHFERETDDLGEYLISRFKVGAVLAAIQAYVDSTPSQFNLYVDVPGCRPAKQDPFAVASTLLVALGLRNVAIVWSNDELQQAFSTSPTPARPKLKGPVTFSFERKPTTKPELMAKKTKPLGARQHKMASAD